MTAVHPYPPLAPLTADEFNAGAVICGSGGVPIVENEDATHVYSYGHVDPQAMADAVNAWDQEMVGDFSMDWRTGADEVQHAYAVTIKGAGDPEGWWMSWRDVTAETPGAFPISLVTR